MLEFLDWWFILPAHVYSNLPEATFEMMKPATKITEGQSQNFVIIASQRTGSNLLQSLLNSHSNVLCLGEVFSQGIRTDMLGPKKPIVLKDPWLQDLKTEDLRSSEKQQNHFLDVFFKQKYPGIDCKGFRLFYEHTQNRTDNALWRSLKSRNSLIYIHLIRKNHLKRYLSLCLAQKTDIWVSTESPNKPPAVHLNYHDCLAFIKAAENTIQSFRAFLGDSNVLEFYYEDIVRNRSEQMERILQHLTVRRQELESPLKRINTLPLKKSILNYSELKASFTDSPWNHLFEE